jgi:hypothetical protein
MLPSVINVDEHSRLFVWHLIQPVLLSMLFHTYIIAAAKHYTLMSLMNLCISITWNHKTLISLHCFLLVHVVNEVDILMTLTARYNWTVTVSVSQQGDSMFVVMLLAIRQFAEKKKKKRYQFPTDTFRLTYLPTQQDIRNTIVFFIPYVWSIR